MSDSSHTSYVWENDNCYAITYFIYWEPKTSNKSLESDVSLDNLPRRIKCCKQQINAFLLRMLKTMYIQLFTVMTRSYSCLSDYCLWDTDNDAADYQKQTYFSTLWKFWMAKHTKVDTLLEINARQH